VLSAAATATTRNFIVISLESQRLPLRNAEVWVKFSPGNCRKVFMGGAVTCIEIRGRDNGTEWGRMLDALRAMPSGPPRPAKPNPQALKPWLAEGMRWQCPLKVQPRHSKFADMPALSSRSILDLRA
jgi:hypothetical protein